MAYDYDSPMFDAVEDKHKATWEDFDSHARKRLDYILYSKAMLCNTGVTAKYTQVDDHTIINQLSDHALLIGGLMLKEDTA